MPPQPRLDAATPEILERIGLFAFRPYTTHPFADLHALAACKRSFALQLQPTHNPVLYAEFFYSTFDCAALQRRTGIDLGNVAPAVVAHELRVRFQAMWRFRSGHDIDAGVDSDVKDSDLWTILLMLFEDDGRNRAMLDLHADVRRAAQERLDAMTAPGSALRDSLNIATGTPLPLGEDGWLVQTREMNMLAWIVWLIASADSVDRSERHEVTPFALYIHRYPLSSRGYNFEPSPLPVRNRSKFEYFGRRFRPRDAEFIPMAILHYFAHHHPALKQSVSWDSFTWDSQYVLVTDRYRLRPGTFCGLWKGISHGSRSDGLEMTWTLREYSLQHSSPSAPVPMTPGNWATGFISPHAIVWESPRGTFAECRLGDHNWTFRRAMAGDPEAEDLILLGEGESVLGSFTLRGRVRACDGFISLIMQYVTTGETSSYCGFVIGARDARFVGRWCGVDAEWQMRMAASHRFIPPPFSQDPQGCFLLERLSDYV